MTLSSVFHEITACHNSRHLVQLNSLSLDFRISERVQGSQSRIPSNLLSLGTNVCHQIFTAMEDLVKCLRIHLSNLTRSMRECVNTLPLDASLGGSYGCFARDREAERAFGPLVHWFTHAKNARIDDARLDLDKMEKRDVFD